MLHLMVHSCNQRRAMHHNDTREFADVCSQLTCAIVLTVSEAGLHHGFVDK